MIQSPDTHDTGSTSTRCLDEALEDTGGRWSPPGRACVYASLSPASALLEYLAHLEGETPRELMLAVATIPPGTVLSETNEPSTWKELPYRH